MAVDRPHHTYVQVNVVPFPSVAVGGGAGTHVLLRSSPTPPVRPRYPRLWRPHPPRFAANGQHHESLCLPVLVQHLCQHHHVIALALLRFTSRSWSPPLYPRLPLRLRLVFSWPLLLEEGLPPIWSEKICRSSPGVHLQFHDLASPCPSAYTQPHNCQERKLSVPSHMRLCFQPWFWARLRRVIESTLRRLRRDHASVCQRIIAWRANESTMSMLVSIGHPRSKYEFAIGWGDVAWQQVSGIRPFYLLLYSFRYRARGSYTHNHSFLSERCKELWSGNDQVRYTTAYQTWGKLWDRNRLCDR